MGVHSKLGSLCLDGFTPVKFLASNSRSLSNIWILKSNIGNQLLFCKVFVQSNGIERVNDMTGLAYESKVYSHIKKQLSKPEYCDFKENFIQLESVCKNLTFSELMSKVGVSDNVTEARVKRNIRFMVCGNPSERPALNEGDDDEYVDDCDNNWDAGIEKKGGSYVMPEDFQYTIIATRSPENTLIS